MASTTSSIQAANTVAVSKSPAARGISRLHCRSHQAVVAVANSRAVAPASYRHPACRPAGLGLSRPAPVLRLTVSNTPRGVPPPASSVLDDSATMEVKSNDPFGLEFTPIIALALAGLDRAGGYNYISMDLGQMLAWGVVATVAASYVKGAPKATYEVTALAAASLALTFLSIESLPYLAVTAFGVMLSRSLPKLPWYVGVASLALAAWQGYSYTWFAAAYAVFFGYRVFQGVDSKKFNLVDIGSLIASLAALGVQYFGDKLWWLEPKTWSMYILISIMASALLSVGRALVEENK